MTKLDKKNNIYSVLFVFGLILYLIGLFLLLCSSVGSTTFLNLSKDALLCLKIIGIVSFILGFLIFVISFMLVYKKNKIIENNKELIVEGKAGILTILFMYYLLLLMLVLCLYFDNYIGALLFGIAIFIQMILNNILIKYYSSWKR